MPFYYATAGAESQVKIDVLIERKEIGLDSTWILEIKDFRIENAK